MALAEIGRRELVKWFSSIFLGSVFSGVTPGGPSLMDSNVSKAVPGMTTIEQIEECIALMATSFTQKDLSSLKGDQAFLRGRICTFCGGCMGGCPWGVPSQALIRLWMYLDGYENDSFQRDFVEEDQKEIYRSVRIAKAAPSVADRDWTFGQRENKLKG